MREIALIFVMHGADLELRDNYKKTAQAYAAQNQIFEVSDVLGAVTGEHPPNDAPGSPPPLPEPRGIQTSPLQGSRLASPGMPGAKQPSHPVSPPELPFSASPNAHAAAAVATPVAFEPADSSIPVGDPALEAYARSQVLSAEGVLSLGITGAGIGGEEEEEEGVCQVSPGGTKKKNNTVLRHLDMIQGAPKVPFGPDGAGAATTPKDRSSNQRGRQKK